MTSVGDGTAARGWYHGWNIVAVCILAQVAGNALPVNAFSLFLHDWSAELHTPISTLQLGLAGCGIGCSLLSPLIGVFADKYPSRLLFGIGLLGMTLLCLCISLVQATWQLIILYALLAPFAICLCTSIPANAVVSRWFVRRLGLALGLTAFGLALAGIVMPPVVAAVMPDIGWRMIWRIAGVVIAVVILPLVVLVLRDRPSERDGLYYLQGAKGEAPVPHHGHGGAGGDPAFNWRRVFRNRNFWGVVVIYLPMLAVYGGCGQNLGPIAISRGMSQQTAGILLSVFSTAQLAATLASGLLSDRFGNRLPLVGLALGCAVGGVTVAFGQNVFVLGIGVALAGTGGGFWPLLAAACAREFGSGFGRAFGLVMFFLPIAVMAPFAVAKVQENAGSYAPALLWMSALTVLAAILCFLLMREKPQGSADSDGQAPSREAAIPAS